MSDKKTAIVTGAPRGIGAGLVEAFLKEGYKVNATSRDVSRFMADYLPPQVSRSADYQLIFQLERKLGSRPEFVAVAGYMQYLAHRAGPVVENRA
jgi:NAD(P)-dependent dehydrogenase (short-subunit alcohol dehydrogenase family)